MSIERKSSPTRTRAKTSGRTTKVVASTPTPDRYNDVVAPNWNLGRFMDNPVIQFGHRYDIPPVGKAVSVELKGDRLMAEIRWDDSQENELGRLVKSQFERGFLNTVSVGFTPAGSTPRNRLEKDHPAYAESGTFFEGPHELMEISAVPIPANAEALALRSIEAGPSVRRHILNIEETEDAWVVSYAKAEAEAEPEEQEPIEPDEVEGYGSDDEDEDDHGASIGIDDEEDEGDDEERAPFGDEEDEEDEEDDDEEMSSRRRKSYHTRAERIELRSEVRRMLLEILGEEPAPTHDPVADMFGLTS